MQVNRRTVLKSGLVMCLGSVHLAAFVADGERMPQAGEALLQQVHRAWVRAKGVEPGAFLSCTGCTVLDESALRLRIRHDFLAGDVEEYEGLVLSRTEFALWAWLGQGA